MAFYKLFSEPKSNEELGSYTAYGIVASEKHITKITADISVDKEKALALVALFNSEGLSITHLEEAIEDFLYDFEV